MSCISNISTRRARALAPVACALLGAAGAASGQCQEPTQLLTPPGDDWRLVMEEGLLVVRDRLGGGSALHTYVLDGETWSFSDSTFVDNAGAIDISGGHLVIGRSVSDAPYQVEVLVRDQDRWRAEATLATPGASAHFGASVAIGGNAIMVGEPDPYGAPRAHIYRLGPQGWTLEHTFAPPDPTSLADEVAIEGDLAAITRDYGFEGSLRFLRFDGSSWVFEDEVFTYAALAIQVDDARVLAASGLGGATPARLFAADGSAWGLQGRLPGLRVMDAARARTVVLDGDRALFAGHDHEGDLDLRTVAYVYERDADCWRLARRLVHTASSTYLTGGAALSGGWAAVAAADGVRLYDLTLGAGACPPAPPPDPLSGLRLNAGGLLSPQTPQLRVLAQGVHEPDVYCIAGVRFDVEASEPGWSGLELLLAVAGTYPGLIEGPIVAEIIAGQYHQFAYQIGDPASPIDLWQANFGVTDFTPRVISLRARAYQFAVNPYFESSLIEPRILGIVDPETTIRVWRSSCLADCDGSGALDIFDFLCFQELFAAGNLACDFDEDGMLTLFDFLAFQNEFAGGCP